MEKKELIVSENCLPAAAAAVRSPEALAEFYSLTSGPLQWSAEFQTEEANRFLNSYRLFRQNADGEGVIQLSLTESVIVESKSDGASREIVVDRPAERTAIDNFPDDAEADEGLDSFCAFLAQNAGSFQETLVKPYLAAKAITLENGEQGVVRDHGTLKFVLLTNEGGTQVGEVRLYGIDLASIDGEEADPSGAFDGYQSFLSIRPPVQTRSVEAGAATGIAVESRSIDEEIDADSLAEPESESKAGSRGMEASRAPVAEPAAAFDQSGFVPPFFMTSRKVLSQADPITDPQVLESAGGGIRHVQHPENADACLRLINLPPHLKATTTAAKLLAQSGAIQSGDVLLSFRPGWSRTNAYGNVQLGLSHAALAMIDPRGGDPKVHTVENPIKYSSPLTYKGHYKDLDYMHIVRPALSPEQKSNLRKWAFQILTKRRGHISFYGNYGSPYYSRSTPHQDPISISQKLAKIVTTGSGSLAAYCSELVWAILGLRDCDPDTYIPGMEKPIFDPLTGAEERLLLDPGLVQGPDITLRQSGLDDDTRRNLMTRKVLVDIVTNPSQLQGIMSSGHREAARANQPKIDQLKAFHNSGEPAGWLGQPWSDSSNPQTNLNYGVVPNYSPTSFFIMTNSDAVNESGDKLMKYIGTVAFRRP